MGGLPSLFYSRGERESDNVGAVNIASVVLEYQPWSPAVLFITAAGKFHEKNIAYLRNALFCLPVQISLLLQNSVQLC